MDDKTACQTPSREISARMKRLRLHATEFKQKVDREFAPIDRDDSLNSTFDSELGSPMRLITRASLCHDESSQFQFSPLLRPNHSIDFSARSKTDPIKPSQSESEEDVFDLNDARIDEEELHDESTEKFENLFSKEIKSTRKRPLLESVCQDSISHDSKKNRLNGSTPRKLNVKYDIFKLLKEDENTNKIGDFSSLHALPLSDGPQGAKFKYLEQLDFRDLLLQGNSDIHKIEVIDARFPYEFKGGHIINAKNIPSQGDNGKKKTQELIEIFFTEKCGFDPKKRRIAIFHCEFSSERGPRMYTLFREYDRAKHKYPMLQWPEIYLLKGGYKDFWELNKDHSRAKELFGVHGYVAMLDDENELHKVRKIRRKCQTAPPSMAQRRIK